MHSTQHTYTCLDTCSVCAVCGEFVVDNFLPEDYTILCIAIQIECTELFEYCYIMQSFSNLQNITECDEATAAAVIPLFRSSQTTHPLSTMKNKGNRVSSGRTGGGGGSSVDDGRQDSSAYGSEAADREHLIHQAIAEEKTDPQKDHTRSAEALLPVHRACQLSTDYTAAGAATCLEVTRKAARYTSSAA